MSKKLYLTAITVFVQSYGTDKNQAQSKAKAKYVNSIRSSNWEDLDILVTTMEEGKLEVHS